MNRFQKACLIVAMATISARRNMFFLAFPFVTWVKCENLRFDFAKYLCRNVSCKLNVCYSFWVFFFFFHLCIRQINRTKAAVVCVIFFFFSLTSNAFSAKQGKWTRRPGHATELNGADLPEQLSLVTTPRWGFNHSEYSSPSPHIEAQHVESRDGSTWSVEWIRCGYGRVPGSEGKNSLTLHWAPRCEVREDFWSGVAC